MEETQCPKCGCKEIGKGKLDGHARIVPLNKIFTTGSAIIATICTNCGHILEMQVAIPEKFKVK